MTIAFTAKQHEVIEKILKSADKGEELAFPDLWTSLSYYPVSKQTVQQTLRRLTQAGYIETLYGTNRKMRFRPTLLAYQHFRT